MKCGVLDKKLSSISKKLLWKDIKKAFFILLKSISNFRVIFHYMFPLIIVYCLVFIKTHCIRHVALVISYLEVYFWKNGFLSFLLQNIATTWLHWTIPGIAPIVCVTVITPKFFSQTNARKHASQKTPEVVWCYWTPTKCSILPLRLLVNKKNTTFMFYFHLLLRYFYRRTTKGLLC